MKQTQAGATFGDCEGMVHPHLTVMVDLTAEDATALVRRIGQVYPGAVMSAARELNLVTVRASKPVHVEVSPGPIFRGGSGFDDPEFAEPCDLHCADPGSTSCEHCRPSLHGHDCCACDGHKEVCDDTV